MIVASTKKVGYRPSILSTLSVYSVRRVFSLVLFKIFPFFSSVHFCVLSRLPSLESPMDPTRHALYVRLVSLLSLFCMPNERHMWAAGEWDIKRGGKVLKRHKGRLHALKGNDGSVTVVIVMVMVWVVVDFPLDIWKFVLPRDAAAADVLRGARYNVLLMAAFRNNDGRTCMLISRRRYKLERLFFPFRCCERVEAKVRFIYYSVDKFEEQERIPAFSCFSRRGF